MNSTESNVLNRVRKCFTIKRFLTEGRDDYLFIQISPSLNAREYSIADDQISKLIIATRDKGISLFPIIKWPVRVYIIRVLIENPEERDVLKDDELELIDWAELYETEESAQSQM